MRFENFEYDGITLRDKGFVICDFGSKGNVTESSGSKITFKTVPAQLGQRFDLTSARYDKCLEATFQICKDPCVSDDHEIKDYEIRDIMRWLSRKEFHKLKFIDPEHRDIFYEATFNVNKVEYDGIVYGLELEMTTNRPFAQREKIEVHIVNAEPKGTKAVSNLSDEIGFIYPKMEITIKETGDLEIYNKLDDRTMKIKNCVAGEVITIDYPLIASSIEYHKIQNDFNWDYLRLVNTYKERRNVLTISIPCEITIEYYPIVKIGV